MWGADGCHPLKVPLGAGVQEVADSEFVTVQTFKSQFASPALRALPGSWQI